MSSFLVLWIKKGGGTMKRAIALLVLFAFVFMAAAAFAGEGCKSASTCDSGWQQTYNSIASWSWGSGKSSKDDKGTGKLPCGCPVGNCTCKK